MNFQRQLLGGIVLVLLLCINPGRTIAGSPIARDFIIYQGEQDQVTPSVAYNPIEKEYLVVWSNDRPGNDDIYARRLSAHGKQIGEWFQDAFESILPLPLFDYRSHDFGENTGLVLKPFIG